MLHRLSLIKEKRFWLLFLVILQFGSVMHLCLPTGTLEAATLLLSFSEFPALRKHSKVIVVSTIYLFFFLFTSSLITSTPINNYIGIVSHVLIVLVVFAFFHNDIVVVKKYLYKVLWFICILGLINFILVCLVPSWFYVVVGNAGYTVNSLGLVFNYLPPNGNYIRNQGLFWEPGVFQILLNVLVYILLIDKKCPIKKSLIPGFLVITTASTTGFVILVYIIAIRLFVIKDINSQPTKKRYIFLLLLLLLPFVYNNIGEKVNGDGQVSSASRMYDYVMGVKVIKDYPIYGIGLNPKKYIELNETVDLEFFDEISINPQRGNTNSVLCIMIFLGVPFGILYLMGLYHQTLVSYRFHFFVVMFLSLLSEPLYATPLIIMIIYSSLWRRFMLKA